MRSRRAVIKKLAARGITFIQILIAIVLLSISVIPVASVFFTSNRNVEKSGALLDATIIMQSVIDTIRTDQFVFRNKGKTIEFPNDKYPEITIDKKFLEKYKATGKIRVEEAQGHSEPDLVSINVELNWIEEGRPRQASIVTYIANVTDIKYDKIE